MLYILSEWFSLTVLPLLISLLGIIGKKERRFPHYSNKDDKYVYTEIDSVYFECVVADGSYHRYVGMHHQSGYIFKDGACSLGCSLCECGLFQIYIRAYVINEKGVGYGPGYSIIVSPEGVD